ncbi:MAG: efflux RND transporter permease subunit [Lachnospiraceae bacterium]|nr:efflux RND transporter permease subunit [Lachnospiraceae bacterium]
MLAKFSVKKPYTVIVGIVLVIVLGVVSFSRMTTDLLPDMSLPYAVVLTTYPGASPSEVEESVSKPVEQAMASISNIENVQSVSSENVSMVILEFAQSTDMDSVSLEMRESLDQISAYWDDSIGNPIIMKINPDMMPVMVAAVEKDGLDNIGITDYAQAGLISDIESLEGVASVTASGEVEQSVQVILRQEKIDEVNQKVQDALEGKFADAQKELTDAEIQLNDAQEELNSGKSQLENGQQSAAGQIASAQSQLNQKQNEILKTEIDLDNKLTEIASKITELQTQKAELQTQKEQLQGALSEMEKLPEQVDTLKEQINALDQQIEQLSAFLSNTEQLEQIVQLKNAIDALEAKGDSLTEEERAALEQLKGQYDQAAAVLSQMGITRFSDAASLTEQLQSKLEEMKNLRSTMQTTLTQLEAALAEAESGKETIRENINKIDDGIAQIEEGIRQLEDAKAQIETAKSQIASGKTTLSDALQELNKQQINATIQMAGAAAEISLGQLKLDEGKEQLEQGKEQLSDQKDAALEAADMSSKITMETIQGILTAQNFSMPAGYVTEDGIQYLVRVGNKFEDLDDMQDLVLFDLGIDGLDPIRLMDVADVVLTDNSGEVYAKINGQDGILLTIQKQTGYSTGEVSDRLNDFFDDLMGEDDTIHVTTLMDQGIYIDMVVESVLQNLAMGAILAVLILFLFLRDIRPTAVVACSIPVSLLCAVVLMYFSGITLNVISLSGLALGVGMLVDNSIVVIENIYRLHSLGLPVRKAAVQGAKQMSGAILASTLTTVCVYVPIIFMEGITRQLFVDMGLTIAYSLLASLVIALTFVPMMASGLLKKDFGKKKEKKNGFGNRVMKGYEKILTWSLHHKPVVLGAVVLILAVSAAASFSKGFSFMPNMESTQASMTVTLPEGASVEETGEMTDQVIALVSELPDVESIGAMVGSGNSLLGGSGSTNSATIYLILSEKKELTGEELEKKILDMTEDLNCEVSVSSSMMDMSALGSSGVAVQIKGKEMDQLQKAAKEIAEILEKVEGIKEVSDGMDETTEELRLVVKKEEAAKHNLTVAQVYQQIRQKLAESSSTTTLSTDTEDYQIYVENQETKNYTREDVKKFTITSTGTDGSTEEIPLEELADFEDAEGLDSIRRINQNRYITVSGEVDADHNVTLVSDEVEEALKDYEIPSGCTWEMTGEDATIRDAMNDVLLMLVLALIFMYLIMVAQFQSLLSPFIVMFTIPLAFTGGFLGLLAVGMDVSIIAMLGMVMLCGVIVNNGIVLVDYINQLRGAGMEKHKAIVLAGKTRMRPILMTALTTILGLSTMAAGLGMGADMTQPMAVVVIGGLLYGTLLTLFVVPCIYDLLNRRQYVKIQDSELDAADEELDLIKETNLLEETEDDK